MIHQPTLAELGNSLERRMAELDAEIVGHLGAAISQSLPTDDQIIMDHVRAAYEAAKLRATAKFPTKEHVARALEAFNGGLVNCPDRLNPRGYATHYRPMQAMEKALRVSVEGRS